MACCLSPLPPCVSDLRRRRLDPQPLHPRRPRWRINLQTMSLRLERRLPVLTRAVAGWRERRTCCQLTAAASQRASRSMCLLSLRRLSRLLVAASNQGSQPPSLGRVLPGCPKPRPPSSPWKTPWKRGGSLTETTPRKHRERHQPPRPRTLLPKCAGARLSGVSL